ncbi:MAG: hypothetical protein IKU35_07270 [Bacteroidaceae bacterium]|nr:hypothetical protein [Bacteroidaceae bacterium]
MKKLRITVFADPVCTWCWGSAPVLRALEYRLGDMVEIDYVMCGMIEDIRTFVNRRLNIGRTAVNIESYEQFPDVIDELLKSAEVGMAPKANSFKIYNLKDKKGFSQEREHELHHSWS